MTIELVTETLIFFCFHFFCFACGFHYSRGERKPSRQTSFSELIIISGLRKFVVRDPCSGSVCLQVYSLLFVFMLLPLKGPFTGFNFLQGVPCASCAMLFYFLELMCLATLSCLNTERNTRITKSITFLRHLFKVELKSKRIFFISSKGRL